MTKGTMRLMDRHQAERLYADMPPATERSGGCAANTAAGVASFGGKAAFVGKVDADELGDVFAHDIRAAGVRFVPSGGAATQPTGRSLILITPDAERTMNTYLGAAGEVTADGLDDEVFAEAAVTYVEGFLWDPPPARAALRRAVAAARGAGRQVAFTLSDPLCVERNREDFLDLLADVDILFANEAEILALLEVPDLDVAVSEVRSLCRLAALTRGAAGSVLVAGSDVVEVEAAPVDRVVDTTGAGDLYAAGVLFGYTHQLDLPECGRLGSLAAAEVIGHDGARPEHPLAAFL